MIDKYGFGKIKIIGVCYKNDIKIINGTVVPDWRRQSGHRVDVGDVTDILDARPEILVIGTGKFGMMKVMPALRDFLRKNKIVLIEKSTTEAVKIFNHLQQEEGKNVSAGFHLTC